MRTRFAHANLASNLERGAGNCNIFLGLFHWIWFFSLSSGVFLNGHNTKRNIKEHCTQKGLSPFIVFSGLLLAALLPFTLSLYYYSCAAVLTPEHVWHRNIAEFLVFFSAFSPFPFWFSSLIHFFDWLTSLIDSISHSPVLSFSSSVLSFSSSLIFVVNLS